MHTIPGKTYNAPQKNHLASESSVSGVEDSLKSGSKSASEVRPEVFSASAPSAEAPSGETCGTATPLMPLRDRDEHVLVELFAQEGIEAIEEDIVRNLQIRCPEPCWEDDSLEFLRDYL